MQDGATVVERLEHTLNPASYEANAAEASDHVAVAEAVLEMAETWHEEAAQMDVFLRCCCSPPPVL